jgi:hypothetical protein
MYSRGIPVDQIAQAFGAKLPAVRMALTRAGVYRPTKRTSPTNTVAARAKVEAQKASLAEHVAEGGSISGWGASNGVADGWVWQLWRKIRNDLGEQAC